MTIYLSPCPLSVSHPAGKQEQAQPELKRQGRVGPHVLRQRLPGLRRSPLRRLHRDVLLLRLEQVFSELDATGFSFQPWERRTRQT